MNIVFILTGVTSCVADCWRVLRQRSGVRLKIYLQVNPLHSSRFDKENVLRELDYTLVRQNESFDKDTFRSEMSDFQPTILFIGGWRRKLPRFFATDRSFASIPKILIFDLPFEWTLKKLIAPIVLYPYLKRFNGVFIPGKYAMQYARWLGFKEKEIMQGLLSINISQWVSPIQDKRPQQGFLFIGRYERVKRLDILVEAYKKYRKKIEQNNKGPCWTLTCCGMGSLEGHLKNVDGIENQGFLQPDEIRVLHKKHKAFVLTSDQESWGVVLAEACASGLPIICTEACRGHVELVKGNGFVCGTNDSDAIAEAMFQIHNMPEDERTTMGMKGVELVNPYSCEAWAARVVKMTSDVLNFSHERT